MPPLAALAPILTAVAAAGTLAATGYELANQPGSSSASDAAQVAAQQKQQQAAMTAQQKTAFLAAQPNVQASTGGSLTSNAFNTAAATQAGVPSDLNSIAKYLGLTPPGSSGGGGSPTANVSGGITTTPGQPSGAQSYDLQQLSDLLRQAA